MGFALLLKNYVLTNSKVAMVIINNRYTCFIILFVLFSIQSVEAGTSIKTIEQLGNTNICSFFDWNGSEGERWIIYNWNNQQSLFTNSK